MSGQHHDDYAVEPLPGLPQRLPEGEHIVWQGAPIWRDLVLHAFHLRAVGFYFGLLIAWRVWFRWSEGGGRAAAITFLSLASIAALGLGLLCLVAWLSSRTTLYTLTNRRLVMRVGIALPVAVNIPFGLVGAAGLRVGANGVGDIVLSLVSGNRISFGHLWPHVRPWRFSRPEPLLRSIGNVEAVAAGLAAALLGEAVKVAIPASGAKEDHAVIGYANVQTS